MGMVESTAACVDDLRKGGAATEVKRTPDPSRSATGQEGRGHLSRRSRSNRAMEKLRFSLDRHLELRVLDTEDTGTLFALTNRNREYLRQWLPWLDGTMSASDTRRFIQRSIEQAENDSSFQFGIYCEGILAGMIGYHSVDWQHRHLKIGYWLGQPFEGRGIVTKATGFLLDYAFDNLRMNRVAIHCAVENWKSRALPERLGFAREGLLRQAQWLYDRYVDEVVYAMLAEEWPEKKRALGGCL